MTHIGRSPFDTSRFTGAVPNQPWGMLTLLVCWSRECINAEAIPFPWFFVWFLPVVLFFYFFKFFFIYFFPACGFKGLLFHAFLVHALPNEPLESDVRRSWLHPLEETCLWSFLKDSHGGHQLWPWRISERMEWSCTPEDVGSEAGMWKELDTPWFICFLMTVTSMKPLPQHRSSDGHWGCSDK